MVEQYREELERLRTEHGALVEPCTKRQRNAIWCVAMLVPPDTSREETEEFISRLMLIMMVDDEAPERTMMIHEVATWLIDATRKSIK